MDSLKNWKPSAGHHIQSYDNKDCDIPHKTYCGSVLDENDKTVCSIEADTKEELDRKRSFIAAAPELRKQRDKLLEALNTIMDGLGLARDGRVIINHSDSLNYGVKIARTAIAEVEGEN